MSGLNSYSHCVILRGEILVRRGPSIKYVTNWPILPPLPCHTSSHILGPPKARHTSRTPRFLEGLVQKTRKKAPYKFCLNCFGGFCPGVLSGGLLSRRFCPGWFLSVPVLSEYICYNRKLNTTLIFMFCIYHKIYKCDVTCPLPLPCHKLSHLLGPLPSSVTYFMGVP